MLKRFLHMFARLICPEEVPSNDIIIVVLGPAGSGKSTFINTATNTNKMHVEHALGAVNKYISCIECNYPGDDDGRSIVFVDTPPIDSDPQMAMDIQAQIHHWLGRTYPRRPRVDGIMFLYKMNATRATETMTASTYTNVFESLLGPDYAKKMIILTTMWNAIEMEDCLRREKQLRWGLPKERFDQTIGSAWRAVDILLSKHPELCGPMTRSPEIGDVIEEHIIIAVMGRHGSGKSSFINMVTSSAFMETDGQLNTCTTDLGIVKYHCEQSDLDFIFIDTPGCDCVEDVRQVLEKITLWLRTCYRRNVKLTGIIWLHRVVDNWIRLSNIPTFFQKACAEKSIRNLKFVTTMWDQYPPEAHPSVEWEADIHANYWKPLIDRGCQTHRYLGTPESAWEIMDSYCVRGGAKYETELQREMARLGKALLNEDDGRAQKAAEVYGRLRGFISKERGTLRQIRALVRNGAKESELLPLRYSHIILRRQVFHSVEEIKVFGVPIGAHLSRLSATYTEWEGKATLILPGEMVMKASSSMDSTTSRRTA
ncbi:hypothetical protein ONZ45_g12971 [Pleurotus djamor]|nr:hypothetical protein ONZ45_g12971 [Pleurotus djamor]